MLDLIMKSYILSELAMTIVMMNTIKTKDIIQTSLIRYVQCWGLLSPPRK